MYYYQIYVENCKNIYTYKSRDKYEIGEWCLVNFVNRNKMGLVVSEISEEELTIDIEKIKFISGTAPVLSIPLSIMELVKWVKDYYLSDYNNVIKTAYPGVLKLNYSKKAIYIKDLEITEKSEKVQLSEKNEENSKSDSIEKFNEYMMKKKRGNFSDFAEKFFGRTDK